MYGTREAWPTAIAGAAGEEPPLIAARVVRKTYKVGEQCVRALDGVSIDIHEGESWPSLALRLREIYADEPDRRA